MRTHWEYALVQWEMQIVHRGNRQVQESSWSIWIKGEPTETRPGDHGALKVLSELGELGWELVSLNTESAAVFGKVNNYPDASSPIKQWYIFKRPGE